MKCGLNTYNTCFRASITDKEIDDFKNAKQHFSDCYLMTTLETLSHSSNGRKILKKQIEHDDTNPYVINCYLYKKNGDREKYSIPTNSVVKGYEKLYKAQSNEIIRSMDISVGEYEKKYKAKPWFCRFTDNFKTYSFENSLPSHFMKMFTGIEPTVNIAEKDTNIDLSAKKDEVMALFRRMEKEKDHSLIICTGMKALDGHSWHVYILEDVDLENNTVTVKEKRGNTPQILDIDTALSKFKFIVGYFNSDLEDKSEKTA